MSFEPSPKVQALQAQLQAFMAQHIYPNEARHARKPSGWARGPFTR